MTANTQGTLKTPQLTLVPLTHEHRKDTMKLDMDARVMEYIAFGRPFTEDEATEMHNWLVKCATCVPGFGTWAGYNGQGDFVGWWILGPVPVSSDKPDQFLVDRAEYGFRVAPEFWGRGYAKEGAEEMLRHAFEDLGLAEVAGETMAVNKGSRAVMERGGLKHVDTFFNEYPTPPPGIEHGEVRYAIGREEWLAWRDDKLRS
ncbi:hypothetical protein V2A60_001372 [Cordyceps javanica]|uniref:Acetyltransferase, GNAT family n=1 Tax=Cordyceps javanica TaxID=43265 RepID=A0A545VEX9_9HYPO|nr:acetyltransferase, GNAT family [Cordyceps javanica]TQW11465.1 acetyltransferase, GNAT family [Cordyceps javanica]